MQIKKENSSTKESAQPRHEVTLGKLATTLGVLDEIPAWDILAALARHQGGDWGDVSLEDREENDRSLRDGNRLMSVYHTREGVGFWIITEADRSVTTVLLPSEY